MVCRVEPATQPIFPPTRVRKISWVSSSLRRGFTLVEMTVVVAIVAAIAAIVAPRVFVIQRSAESSAAMNKLIAAIETGRSVARTRGDTIAVGLDAATASVNLSTVDEELEEKLNEDIGFGGTLTIDTIERTSMGAEEETEAQKGETLTEFYADGSAQPATVELKIADRAMTIRVRGDGTLDLSGDISTEATEAEKWSAGEIEQRG